MWLVTEPVWNFEQEPHDPTDETGVNLRAYLDRMPDEKMQQYSPAWSDDEVVATAALPGGVASTAQTPLPFPPGPL